MKIMGLMISNGLVSLSVPVLKNKITLILSIIFIINMTYNNNTDIHLLISSIL